MIEKFIAGDDIHENISRIIADIHANGPVKPELLERLAYYKKFHPNILANYESQLLNVMGLFYKSTNEASSVIEEIYHIFCASIEKEFGSIFTPVQASVYKCITKDRYFSFSAPTSAGKSFLFREIITNATGDLVIVVPSRALIAEYYKEVISLVPKTTLVLQFIENINTSKIKNRVFIITPERGVELFKRIQEFNIEMFLFDEAQISEEYIRGMKFDAFVRRVDRLLPAAKKIFAHPFVLNPEAQLQKHGFVQNSDSHNYKQQSVGKIFISHEGGTFSFFTPHGDPNKILCQNDIIEETLKNNGTLLVYVAKNIIYSGKIIERFSKYIELCGKVDNGEALSIIKKLKDYIGASDTNLERYSQMIALMERGIVIHHGSMPLKARLLIEEFIRKGYARICFSTSTLVQGINMPFNIVWINSFYEVKGLTLKNLIGRAGRTSSKANCFDYGYAIIEKINVNTFISRYNEEFSISNKSMIDDDLDNIDEDLQDIAEAVTTETFNDELNMPTSQLTRIENSNIEKSILYILNALFKDGHIMSGHEYYKLDDSVRKKVKDEFKKVYCAHLKRKSLSVAEKSVLSAAIPIILWQIQSTSFSQIVSLRHSLISRRDERAAIIKLFMTESISRAEMLSKLRDLKARYSPIASTIPNKNLNRAGLFDETTSVLDISYDVIVYDTYDYLDKVISISMADPLCAALKIYSDKTDDIRAQILGNYIRYGTNDSLDIWLLRYGFSSEDLEWLHVVVDKVDSTQIYFNKKIAQLDSEKYAIIERFL